MSLKRLIIVISIISAGVFILLVVVGVRVYKSTISPLLGMHEVPPSYVKPKW